MSAPRPCGLRFWSTNKGGLGGGRGGRRGGFPYPPLKIILLQMLNASITKLLLIKITTNFEFQSTVHNSRVCQLNTGQLK